LPIVGGDDLSACTSEEGGEARPSSREEFIDHINLKIDGSGTLIAHPKSTVRTSKMRLIEMSGFADYLKASSGS
jgi:hypothetical protein